MPILSIIIPIYNVEKYIDKCFESIYNQDVDDTLFEVIAVNDGTPDNSMKIVEKYAKEHTNLRVINKVNGGVSSARNLGIETAIGKYIMFVDPDDYLTNCSLVPLVAKLYNSSTDIILYRAFIGDKEFDSWINYVSEDETISGVELFNRGYKRGAVWGCTYNRLFLENNQLYFPSGVKNGEDTVFFCLCQIYANSISFSNLKLYNVFTREGSATTNLSRERIVSFDLSVQYLNDQLEKENMIYEYKNIVSSYMYAIISQWVYFSVNTPGVDLPFLKTYTNINQYLPIPSFKPMSFMTKLKFILLNKYFSAYYWLVKIKYTIL